MWVQVDDPIKENIVIKDVNRRNYLSWCCKKRGPTVAITRRSDRLG